MKAPTLAAVQKLLQAHLLDPAVAPGDLVAATAAVPGAVRLGIYANAYRVRLVEALAADFAVLHQYLGDAAFAELVQAYLQQFPSRHFSLRPLGQHLEGFLGSCSPYAEHAELRELACFEWALCNAFDAADADVIDGAALAQLAPEQWAQLRFGFHPSLQVIALNSNVPALWQALNAGSAPPSLQFAATPVSWLVWRCELRLLFRPLDTAEADCLACCRSGGSFGDACVALAGHCADDEVPLRAVGLLQQWLRDGLVVSAA